MTFVHPLQQSRDWYTFVSGTAVKDPEILKLVAVYIDAMKKLNRRLLELAGSDPTLKALADAHAFDAAIQMARSTTSSTALSIRTRSCASMPRNTGSTRPPRVLDHPHHPGGNAWLCAPPA